MLLKRFGGILSPDAIVFFDPFFLAKAFINEIKSLNL